MKTPTLFLLAGEKSGDALGQKLVESLQRTFPTCTITGVGGPKMRSAGLHPLLSMEQFEVMGFVDVLCASPRIIRLFHTLRTHLLASPPDILLTIDYPGFNLALARALRKRDFPGKICHYVCPSVWAWGKKRILKMEKALDALFVTLPFECHLFNPAKLDVHYVGHPLVQTTARSKKSPSMNIDPTCRVLALFPGSRPKELQRNFPLQFKVACRLLELYPDLFVAISICHPSFSHTLDQLIKRQPSVRPNRILLVDATQNPALMHRADLAIATSGTVTLELALNHVPTIVTYGIGPLDLFIAKDLLRIRLPQYCLPNIIAGERIYPEFIGPKFTEKALFGEVNQWLNDPSLRDNCSKECAKLSKLLEEKFPEKEISNLVEKWMI